VWRGKDNPVFGKDSGMRNSEGRQQFDLKEGTVSVVVFIHKLTRNLHNLKA